MRKQKEKRSKLLSRLKPADNKFRLLADSAPLMIWQSNPDKLHSYFNKPWLHFVGRSLRQELGNGWLKHVHPDDAPQCWDIYSRAFDARQPFSMTYRLKIKDGSFRWILDRGRAWTDERGTFRGYIGSRLDISERKQAAEALEQSEEIGRAVLRSLRGYIAIVDAQGGLLMCNDLWRRANPEIFPLMQGEPGDNYLEICRRVVRKTPAARQILLNLQAVLKGSNKDLSLEYASETRAGLHWFYIDVVQLRHVSGGAVISFLDITDQKRVEWEAHESRIELAHMRRVYTIGEMAASIAHELNQPLTAILSNAQAAMRILGDTEFPNSGDIRDILMDVIADDKRAGEVIRRLRLLLKRKPMEVRPIQINDLVRDVSRMLRSDAILRRASIHLDLDHDLPMTYGDEVQLQQVLLNLVMNGFDAMADTPLEHKVMLIQTHLENGEKIKISVRDQGHGIGADQLEHIFSPFFTTKQEGLGLGLMVTHSIIEAHKGRIWAENNPEGGAAFHFLLPVHQYSMEAGARS